MTDIKMSSRDRILKAAGQVAREVGPGHLSLDAVAQQAGVSKGGLLYNFPSKAKLLEALVEQHLADFSAALNEKEKHQAAGLGAAYLELFITELKQRQPPPSGVLAALAENPDFLAPVRRFNRDLLDRMKASSEDEGAILVFFLALEGMRALRLFGVDILSPEEQDVANASLTEILLHSQRLA
ncbi:TetR/AcrR family transcriptional regulator [Pseudaminobacter arsenicus]|uniref:TetR/AcrR family transcriptional regulator n=1 Tax=Borborobacter arsenicus TaxID=1851146 RepID=A0A432V566_9HYPH|nr:TetR/AcrR family transcriptional regulator [Pseudaminobacter arsenicus]RUM97295.1 TetR/AcrR family transcriptional regulator [Pseudaminobacter arsenicus]